jgi:TolB protein
MKRSLLLLPAVAAALVAAPPASATFPGENGKLVFQRPVGDQIDLYTIRPDAGRAKPLLDAPVIEELAEWSPDGRRIAFARSAPGGYPTEIWTAGADGGDLRRVTRWNDIASAPTWTPDGRIVYFTTKDFPPPQSDEDPPPPAELYSMTADGGDQRRLTDDEAIQVDPQSSPDGGTISFVQFQAVPEEPGVFDLGLFAIGPDGTGLRTLAPFSPQRDVLNSSWSPDGRQIVSEVAWATPKGNTPSGRQSDLVVMNADGSGLRRLTSTPALETNPAWSPDGRLIAFTSDLHKRRGKRERQGPAFELYVMRADGGGIRRLTRNKVPDLFPDWQATR